jgi:hypothetical protein
MFTWQLFKQTFVRNEFARLPWLGSGSHTDTTVGSDKISLTEFADTSDKAKVWTYLLLRLLLVSTIVGFNGRVRCVVPATPFSVGARAQESQRLQISAYAREEVARPRVWTNFLTPEFLNMELRIETLFAHAQQLIVLFCVTGSKGGVDWTSTLTGKHNKREAALHRNHVLCCVF